MKSAIKLKITIALIAAAAVLMLPTACMALLMMGTTDNNNALAASAYDNPARIQELMLLKSYGVPSDIIMMIVTYLSEDEEEAQTKPFIFPALEFLILREEVKEKRHISCDRYDEYGDLVNDEGECNCDYKTIETNTYRYREAIEKYLGEAVNGLSAENLLQSAQAAADELCDASPADDVRTISFEAVWFVDYEAAIERCGVDDEEVIAGFLELHKAGYFTEWFEDAAKEMGIHPGDSAIIGGSTHNAIRQAIQRPDLANMPFFGGTAIIPVPAGSYYISSEFGPRDYKDDPNHTGLDFAAGVGTPIYSAMNGIILMRVTNMNSFGHHMVVYHGGGVTTMYAHLNAFGSYSPGDTVRSGDVIGYVGTTGKYSTGYHLHFEYQIDGYAYNPRYYLPNP